MFPGRKGASEMIKVFEWSRLTFHLIVTAGILGTGKVSVWRETQA